MRTCTLNVQPIFSLIRGHQLRRKPEVSEAADSGPPFTLLTKPQTRNIFQALECGVPLLVIIGEDELAKGEVRGNSSAEMRSYHPPALQHLHR